MIIREISGIDSKRKMWLGMGGVLWLAMSAWEINNWATTGSWIGVAYIPLFLGLAIWRCAFQYEVILEEGKLSVYMSGPLLLRQWQSQVADVKMLMPVRKRMLLRELGVSNFSHQYSSLDSNPLRVLLVQKRGQKNPHALLFKASDGFYKTLAQNLRRQNPEIILRTLENTK